MKMKPRDGKAASNAAVRQATRPNAAVRQATRSEEANMRTWGGPPTNEKGLREMEADDSVLEGGWTMPSGYERKAPRPQNQDERSPPKENEETDAKMSYTTAKVDKEMFNLE